MLTSNSSFARYILTTTAMATLTGTLPLNLILKRKNSHYYNPEENIGSQLHLIEGDILVDNHESWPEQAWDSHYVHSSRKRRSIESQYYKRWFNRTVPYQFDSKFGHEEIKLVEAAMTDIENNSCIKFKRRTTESDYLRITIPIKGCYSNVGRSGGPQNVGLGEGCFVHGIIQHEVLHALGFWHEQSRRDRDKYIKVIWDNIWPEHQNNFYIQTLAQSQDAFLKLPYDYSSVMHYANNTFAKHVKKPTLVPLFPLPKGVVMGQRKRFSQGDIDKLNALYRCDIHNCTDPGPLTFGTVINSDLSVGSNVQYTCQPGTILVGAPERVCMDIGQWSGDRPACIASTQGNPVNYCNFDHKSTSLCGWTPGKNDELTWSRHTGPTPSNGTGPYWDHTLTTSKGGYAYVEASNSRRGQKARLISPRFEMSSRKRTCLTFFTYMYGSDMGNLSVYLNEERNVSTYSTMTSRALFSLLGEQGCIWKQIFIVLGEMVSPFQITIEGSVGNGYKSDIAVDDIIIGDCLSLKPVVISGGLDENIQCTFDNGDICSFLQDNRDRLDWRITNGKTPTLFTGPNCDPIDCKLGKYLYLESSARANGDKARLKTPILGGSGPCCLVFYHSMYGRDIGQLIIKLTNVISGNTQILWTRHGDQGNRWQIERIDYIAVDAYEVVFEGIVGSGYRGDIALDSISITTGQCSAVRRFDCNFDHDMCDWRNSISPAVSKHWIRHKGYTATPETGPSRDRTNPDGYYIYVEASRTSLGDSARLVSPLVSLEAQCLTFWYHMYGSSIGNLTVIIQTDTGHESVLWSLSGDQGNQWTSKNLNLTSVESSGREYHIIFEAEMAGSKGDVAMDDINLHNTPCSS